MMGHWGGGYGMGWGWGGMILGILVPLLVLGLIIWGAVSVALRGSRPAAGGSSALEILEQRFARGEISAEELRNMRQELQKR